MPHCLRLLPLLAALALSSSAVAQSSDAATQQAPGPLLPQPAVPPTAERPRPVTPRMPSHSLKGFTIPADPENPEPAATDFRDGWYQVSFHVPAGWNFERRNGVLSDFAKETRSAHARSEVRGVAQINFNPWPPTTFAGANFYYSVTPRTSATTCAAQTRTEGMKPLPDTDIGGISFHHGRDNHGAVCTESRDEAFTALRGTACIRFDLVVNTFCGETSGAMEINADQLQNVQARLAGILGSVKIGK